MGLEVHLDAEVGGNGQIGGKSAVAHKLAEFLRCVVPGNEVDAAVDILVHCLDLRYGSAVAAGEPYPPALRRELNDTALRIFRKHCPEKRRQSVECYCFD